MLHVSGGAIASIILLLVICFILPVFLYYLLFRFSDSNIKTFGIGAAAYFVGGLILDLFLLSIIGFFTDITQNVSVYLLYSLILSPAIFVALNFFAIKFFGKNMITTGNSLMYSAGYASLQNIMSVGFVSAGYLITLLDIKSSGGYIVVSDSDYASYSDMVSASNLVSQSVFDELANLCSTPASYFLTLCLDRLWIIAVHSAILLVIWLAVRKVNSLPLLGAAFGMRILVGVPTMLNDLSVISNKWLLAAIIIIIAVLVWVIAVMCWKKFIDRDNAE